MFTRRTSRFPFAVTTRFQYVLLRFHSSAYRRMCYVSLPQHTAMRLRTDLHKRIQQGNIDRHTTMVYHTCAGKDWDWEPDKACANRPSNPRLGSPRASGVSQHLMFRQPVALRCHEYCGDRLPCLAQNGSSTPAKYATLPTTHNLIESEHIMLLPVPS